MSIAPTPRKNTYALMKAGYQMAAACELCGSTENLVIDHIIALSQGGSNELSNLRTLCNSCNTKQSWQNRPRPNLPKYTTYLPPATIKAIKRYALEHDLRDYEVAQAAIGAYLEQTAALEAEIQRLKDLADINRRFHSDTEVRHFKSWLRKRPRSLETDFFQRFLADTRLPQHASRAMYEAKLKAAGYSDEDIALFEVTWKDMLVSTD